MTDREFRSFPSNVYVLVRLTWFRTWEREGESHLHVETKRFQHFWALREGVAAQLGEIGGVRLWRDFVSSCSSLLVELRDVEQMPN